MINPRSDIRESSKMYYIDVELPGVEELEEVKCKWLSVRTFLMEACVKRSPTAEDDVQADKEEQKISVDKALDSAHEGKERQRESVHKAKNVYVTVSERRIGVYGRAFSFPTSVDHAKMTKTLSAGVLSLVVPKVDEPMKPLDVQAADAAHPSI
jgi:HSP20 family molecular chaperone IbpA